MTALLALLRQHHQALMRYDDGTYWRIDRLGIVQGRKDVDESTFNKDS